MYNPDYINWGQQGWICPQCHKTFAPHVSECPYCNAERKTFATTKINITPFDDVGWWDDYVKRNSADSEWWQKYLKQSQTGQPVNENPSTTTATATSNPNVKVTAWNSSTTCEQDCESCDKYEKSCFSGIETTSNNTIISHRKPLETYYDYDFLDSFIKHFQN